LGCKGSAVQIRAPRPTLPGSDRVRSIGNRASRTSMSNPADISQRILHVAAEDPGGFFRIDPVDDLVQVGAERLPAAEVAKGVSGLEDDLLVERVSKGVYKLTGDGWIAATKLGP